MQRLMQKIYAEQNINILDLKKRSNSTGVT